MDEMISVLEDILRELQDINGKLDEIKGDGLYNSISDVCNKLDSLETAIGEVDSSIMMLD